MPLALAGRISLFCTSRVPRSGGFPIATDEFRSQEGRRDPLLLVSWLLNSMPVFFFWSLGFLLKSSESCLVTGENDGQPALLYGGSSYTGQNLKIQRTRLHGSFEEG